MNNAYTPALEDDMPMQQLRTPTNIETAQSEINRIVASDPLAMLFLGMNSANLELNVAI